MKEDLAIRVEQFDLRKLPGQPRIKHPETVSLIHDLHQEIFRLEDLLRDIAISNVEFDDEWVNYVTIQVDRTTWNKLLQEVRE